MLERRRCRALSRRSIPPLFVAALLALLLPGGRAEAAARPTTFQIGGYCVSWAYREPTWLVALADAGLDYVDNLDHHFDSQYGLELVRLLDSLRVARPGFGLKAVVSLSQSDPGHEAFSTLAEVSPATLDRIGRTLHRGGGYNSDAILGWNLADEPCTRAEFERIGTVARFLRGRAETANRLPLVNLFPIAEAAGSSCYEGEFRAGRGRREAYAAYCDAWLAQFDSLPEPAPVLSFDLYPFQRRERARTDYPENLAIASERALAHGRPGARVALWSVIQLSPHRQQDQPYATTPRLAHTRWQAWYAVAYGAKGISYWTLFPIGVPEGPRFDVGLYDEQGRPGERVAGIRILNAQLHALGPTLMALDPVEVWHGAAGPGPGFEVDTDWGAAGFSRPVARATVEPIGGGGQPADLVFAQLRHAGTGDDYLLVMNGNLARPRSFRLQLTARADTVERIDRTTGRAVRVGVGLDELRVQSLGPAEAELYRLADRVVEPIPDVLEIRQDGAQRYFRTAQGILRVDLETGARARVPTLAGRPAAGLRATPSGVVAAD